MGAILGWSWVGFGAVWERSCIIITIIITIFIVIFIVIFIIIIRQSNFCRQLHILGPSASNQHGNNMFADSSTLWPLPPWESLGIPLDIFVLGFDVRFLVKFRFWSRISWKPIFRQLHSLGHSASNQHGNNMVADSST